MKTANQITVGEIGSSFSAIRISFNASSSLHSAEFTAAMNMWAMARFGASSSERAFDAAFSTFGQASNGRTYASANQSHAFAMPVHARENFGSTSNARSKKLTLSRKLSSSVLFDK